MNRRLKTIAAQMLHGSGVLRYLRRRNTATKSIVLTLHRVLPAAELAGCYHPSLAISAETLDALLALLKAEYQLCTLAEALDFSGERDRQRVALTFDDGWEDNFRVALPLLKKYRAPATVFLCPELVDAAELNAVLPEERFARIWSQCAASNNLQAVWSALGTNDLSFPQAAAKMKTLPMDARLAVLAELERTCGVAAVRERRFLNWNEIADMQREGVAFASHTQRHATLTAESRASALAELTTSRREIAAHTGVAPTSIAFPNGAYSPETLMIVRDAGYKFAFTTHTAFITAQSAHFELPRFAVEEALFTESTGRFSAARAHFYLQGLTRR